MKLTELLAEIGDDNIDLQNLSQCICEMRYSAKNGNKFTFVTDQNFGPNGPDKAGLVLWIDRDKMAQAIENLKQKEQS